MGRITEYKAQWAALPPGPQAEEYERTIAVQRAENQVRAEGEEFISRSRDRHDREAREVREEAANLQNVLEAITAECGSRIVDTDKVGQDLVKLDRRRRQLRSKLDSIEREQASTEEQAADPLAFMERLYEMCGGQLVHPLDMHAPPPFRTPSEQSSPATDPGLGGRAVDVKRRRGKLR